MHPASRPLRELRISPHEMPASTPPHGQTDRGTHRIPTLDGLRAISIILVLAAHLLPLGPKSLQLNLTAGAIGMSLFFILSGYLIVTTLRSATITEFVVKRLARILPLAYLYLLIVFMIFGMSKQALLYHLGFVINYRPEQMLPVTAHLWSLCVEVHFYLFVTVLALIGGRKAFILVWPCCAVVTVLRISQGAYIELPTHLRIDEILAGACIASLPAYRFRSGTTPLLIWGAAAGLLAVTSHPDVGWAQYLRPYTAALLLFATISQRPNWLVSALSNRGFRYFAAISYALYVIHPLTAHGWWNDGSIWQRYLIKRPLGLLITLVAAHLSTFYWERAWIHAARWWVRSRHARKQSFIGQPENVT
jgi:peptidoglycan/LPS O-acetylase OafA/YrhL